MKCPRDGAMLESVPYEAGIRVDRCSACRGMYLDQGELQAIQETIERDYSEELGRIGDVVGAAYRMARQKAAPPTACPKCGRQMVREEYAHCSQIMTDVCPDDLGIWLDGGEIEALEVFFERSRLETKSLSRRFWKSLGRRLRS